VPSGIAGRSVGRGRLVAGGEMGELPLEIGQTLGQPVALLTERPGRRLDVRCKAPVPVSPLSRDVVHGPLR